MKTAKPYFTVTKARRLITENYRDMSLDKLLSKRVLLRDYVRHVEQTEIYHEALVRGGYYRKVESSSASGLVPADMWLRTNLGYSLYEMETAITEAKEANL